jgi:hypothetical protein
MFGPSREEMIEDHMFNVRCMVKDYNKTATRYKTEEAAYMKKAKKALKKGDERTAITYVRQSKQYSDLALRTTELACNLEVVEARIKEAINSGKLNNEISQAVSLLLSRLTPKYTLQSVAFMDKAFEDVSTCSDTIMSAVGGVAAPAIGSTLVEQQMLSELKDEVSQEATLELSALPSLDARLNNLSSNQEIDNNRNNIIHKTYF